jgi:hypothetical protein
MALNQGNQDESMTKVLKVLHNFSIFKSVEETEEKNYAVFLNCSPF